MKAENREPLLERLATATGCEYLSDLHASSRLPLLREAIAGCAGRDYPLADWTDAVQYITGETASFSSPEEARAFLYRYRLPHKK